MFLRGFFVIVLVFWFGFETEFLCVSLAVLELRVLPACASQNAGIKGVQHHCLVVFHSFSTT